MTTIKQFQDYLNELRAREAESEIINPDAEFHPNMYNCVMQLACNVFTYAYDFSCQQILRFNDDGSVEEWCDADHGDFNHYEAHFTHESVEEWMKAQIEAVSPLA